MQNQSLPPEFVNALTDKLFQDKDATEVILQTLEHMVGISTPSSAPAPSAVADSTPDEQPAADQPPAASPESGIISERRPRPSR